MRRLFCAMTDLDHIAQLRSEAERSIAAADTTAALEDARVRWLGRRAELPNLLRGVAQLPPEQRGVVGRALNEARQALEERVKDTLAKLEAIELEAKLEEDRVDVTLPGAPPQ